MRASPNYERFSLLSDAWNAATALLDDKGGCQSDLHEAELKFLGRKCCQGLAEDDCRLVFRTAVQIAQATISFRRSRCGSSQPRPSRRYELLLSFAKELETTFPTSDQFLLMAGCKMLEMHWDR